MTRCLVFCVVSVGLLFTSLSAYGQYRTNTSGLVSTVQSRQFGLERPWYTQVEVDRARGGIVQVVHHISSTRAEILYEVVTDRRIYKYSEFGIDRWGEVMGDFGATEAAAKHMRALLLDQKQRDPTGDHKTINVVLGPVLGTIKKIDDLKEQQRKATPDKKIDLNSLNIAQDLLTFAKESPDVLPRLDKRVQPQVTLYALTSRGLVHAIDAETGKTRWSVLVGRPNLPSAGICANDRFVAVVNGIRIHMLDSLDGRLLWTHRADGAPGGGPAMSNTHIFVPLSQGSLLGYEIGQHKMAPIRHMSHGRSMIQPLIVDTSIVWPTDRGLTYVGNASRPGVRYRLETDTNVVSQPAFLRSNNTVKLFVTSLDGYCYCINEKGSGVLWRFSAGVPISHQPVAFGDAVYVITDESSMYRVNAETGVEEWWIPGISDFVAASDTRLYCRNSVGNLLVLDAKTGGNLGQMAAQELDWHFVNTQTDRIFIGTNTGKLQCLNERGIRYPMIHDGDFEIAIAEPEEEDVLGGDDAGDDGGNIFGAVGGGDIFGGGNNNGGNAGGGNAGGGNPFDPDDAPNPFE